MVAIFGDQHMRQQSRPGPAAGNRPTGGRGLNDGVTTATGQLRPNMANDPETGRYVVEDFRDILTQRLEMTATVRTAACFRRMNHGIAWQVIRERFANRLAGGFFHRGDFGGIGPFCLAGFEFLQRQFELPDHFVDLLGALAKPHAPQLGDDQLEMLDFRLLGDHHGLQGCGVAGQRSAVHAASLRESSAGEQPHQPRISSFFMQPVPVARCDSGDASRCPPEAWKVGRPRDAPSLRWPVAR